MRGRRGERGREGKREGEGEGEGGTEREGVREGVREGGNERELMMVSFVLSSVLFQNLDQSNHVLLGCSYNVSAPEPDSAYRSIRKLYPLTLCMFPVIMSLGIVTKFPVCLPGTGYCCIHVPYPLSQTSTL